MKIAILDDYQNCVRTLDAFQKLAGHEVTIIMDYLPDIDELAARLQEAEAIVPLRERTHIGAALLEKLPRLRLISQTGTTPHIDLKACTDRGVIVSSSHKMSPSYATAELTWGLIISALRHIPFEAEALKQGRWQSTLGLCLRGRTLGVFGYGKIGSLIAGYGKAFGMDVLVYGREGSLDRARQDGVVIASSKEELFERADVLSLHIRLTPETKGIVSAEDLARMKPTSLIVNTSRAGLIASGALEAALKNGRPGLAAIDVFETEPLRDPNHPLLRAQNAVATPHIGYVERDSYEMIYGDSFDQVLAFASGHPINVLNPDVLGAAS